MSPADAGTDVQQTVENLNAGWYNEVSNALGLDASTFQLAQGTLGLQSTDSSGLFLMSDAVPPSAAVGYYDAGGMSMRSSAYALLLGALLPETGTDLSAVLGDMYPSWVAYRNAWWQTNPTSTLTQLQLFTQWANQRLDPRRASTAVNTFKQAANSALNNALDALTAPTGKQTFLRSDQTPYTLYTYSATLTAAQQAIQNGASATIDFDSSTMDTNLQHTTAQGSATGMYDIFSGGVSGSFDQLNQTAASSEWTISGTIGKYATLVTQPGTWMNQAEILRAYNAQNDNTIWDAASNVGDWNSFFGEPDGSLARRVSQLVLVSDYQITVTSHASYSEEDVTQIEANASVGIWPFFSADASASSTSQAQLNSAGELTVTHTLNKGLIQIWGVNVLEAPH